MKTLLPVTPSGISLADGERDGLTAHIIQIEREAFAMADQIRAKGWRKLRHQHGLSLRDLEKRTGINRGRLSMIERGLPASPDEAMRMVAVLKVDQ